MGDRSKNFSNAEFRCKCGKCTPILPPDDLIEKMQAMRDHFNASVSVHSGHRCVAYNKRVGGAPASKHLTALACDHTVKGVSNDDVQDYWLKTMGAKKCGIGRYDTFTHFDVRKDRASRWDFRK